MSNTYCSKRPSVRSKHRAVAPIIATLLMVAIAVVGGILVYTFTQGFFNESQVSAPTIDILEIYGFDASNTPALSSHTGTAITMNSGSQDNPELASGDAVVVYVRNKGGSIVTISEVKMFGEAYTIQSESSCDKGDPAKGRFSMSSDGSKKCDVTSIEPGKEVSIFLRYDGANGAVQLGRPLPVTLVTGSGMEFTKQIQNGVQVG